MNDECAWLKYEMRLEELEKKLSFKRKILSSGMRPAVEKVPAAADKSVSTGPENELRSLKAELESLKNVSLRALSDKKDIEALLARKEAEVSMLHSSHKVLENENILLKYKISRLNFNIVGENPERRRGSRKKNILVEWLNKPLVVIESE